MEEQLKPLFQNLESQITLSMADSPHAQQGELKEMLEAVAASGGGKIKVIQNETKGAVPSFQILKNGNKTGIQFLGIPGGHEFTSLILAILNADGKGRLPDRELQRRIRGLKGPIQLQTFVSLSCENCPDVVQALNLMATLRDDFQHTMVDGAFTQDEIEKLGIQGVPSVVSIQNDGSKKLIHSGKISFLDLLSKIEKEFGSANASAEPVDLGRFDVTVIGAGPAGASAAIYSARKGLRTAIIAERFGGQVQDTKGIENLISTLYTEGPQLSAALQKHVESYGITILEHRRVQQVVPEGRTQKIILESGEFFQSQQTIVATGAKWRELNVPGEKEYIGRGVAFCPHCDGPYYKDKKVIVVGGGNSGIEAALDLAGIVREVTVLEFNAASKADQVLLQKLHNTANASLITNAKTKAVVGDGGKVTALEYEDRVSGETRKIDIDGVFVQIGLLPNSQFLKGTVDMTQFGEIVVDGKGHTTVPGIYAAGDVTTTPYKQIVIAMGEGAKVALAAFEDRMHG